ncbi:hypothetical protein SH668x_002019 [Planctomicrobium sp. SH668]|uniref:hypothetical protein n=1 Tax=Planctomicrobium sp. SH668 TaxID=3448126 RepID=UPI003F5C3330
MLSLTLSASLLLLAAFILRGLPEKSMSYLGRMGAVACSVAGLILLFTHLRSVAPVSGSLIYRDDAIARGVLLAALVIPSLLVLLERSHALLATSYWSAGMLALAATTQLPLIQWAALQLSIIPLFFYGRQQREGLRGLIKRNAAPVFGSILFALGFYLATRGDSENPQTIIGIIFLMAGSGAMLGWFPFPRVIDAASGDAAMGTLFGKRILPLITTAVLLFRMVERQPLTTYQSSQLALCAFFCLIICGTRLLGEQRISRRLSLTGMSMFAFLLISICIANWQAAHSKLNWVETSPIPGGDSLFLSILFCEVVALLVFASGIKLLKNDSDAGDFVETVSGSFSRRPVSSLATFFGLTSLAGIPPFPGFWWRLALIAALGMPHRQSNITQMAEADFGYSMLTLIVIFAIILNSIAHLGLIQRMITEEAFRGRESLLKLNLKLAAGLSVLALTLIALTPISIGQVLTPRQSQVAIEVPIPDQEAGAQ